MKTLSIQQPWAWAILHANKDIENRKWPTKFRGQFLIHASKKIDTEGITCLQSRGLNPPIFYSEFNKTSGGLVGVATIIDCVSTHQSDWFSGPYGFVLRNPIPIKFIPFKGKLGFFEIPVSNFSTFFHSKNEG